MGTAAGKSPKQAIFNSVQKTFEIRQVQGDMAGNSEKKREGKRAKLSLTAMLAYSRHTIRKLKQVL